MSLNVTPLTGTIGAAVEGVDLKKACRQGNLRTTPQGFPGPLRTGLPRSGDRAGSTDGFRQAVGGAGSAGEPAAQGPVRHP